MAISSFPLFASNSKRPDCAHAQTRQVKNTPLGCIRATMSKDGKLPHGWTEIKSKSRPGEVYYLNKKTGEKTWKRSQIVERGSSKRKEKQSSSSSHHKSKRKKSDASDDDVSGPVEVHALHILVKHQDSRRPASWRQDPIVIPKSVAFEKIKSIRKSIVQAVTDSDYTVESEVILRERFENLAKEESDCTSAKRGGDLGVFPRGKMQPSFEKAAFGLKVNEMSGPIESDSGIHIILRVK